MFGHSELKILCLGDIVGSIGRRAILQLVPELRKKYKPDLVIANVENLAHGMGITPKTWQEIKNVIDVGTGGNHILEKPEGESLLADAKTPIIRPLNFSGGAAGRGFIIVPTDKGDVLIINATGRVFFREAADYSNPFPAVADLIRQQTAEKKFAAIIVDFHGEATSEKVAMGLWLDGKASAVVGTHTHVPTADARILPGGTAVVTDLGMVGADYSIIGGDAAVILPGFVEERRTSFDIPERGPAVLNGVLLTIDPATGKALAIERVDRQTKIA